MGLQIIWNNSLGIENIFDFMRAQYNYILLPNNIITDF